MLATLYQGFIKIKIFQVQYKYSDFAFAHSAYSKFFEIYYTNLGLLSTIPLGFAIFQFRVYIWYLIHTVRLIILHDFDVGLQLRVWLPDTIPYPSTILYFLSNIQITLNTIYYTDHNFINRIHELSDKDIIDTYFLYLR